MQVVARLPSGVKVVNFSGSSATVADLKAALNITSCSVIANSRALSDSEELVGGESEVRIVAHLDGGKDKKRKKKQYTRPKKIDHKKRKEKLAILKFFKVENEEEGKINRVRMHCVTPSCGYGTFMAAHANRAHCGKCGLTYFRQDKQ